MELGESNKKIKEYIRKNLEKGYTVDAVKISLVTFQGYSRTAVDRAFEEYNHDLAKEVPALKAEPQIVHEIVDENDKPITIEKPFWKRWFGL